VRVTKSSLVRNPTVTRWILGQWAFAPGWALDASAGLTYQMPNLRYLNRGAPSLEPRPERARHLDIAIERRLAESVRWQATVFTRNESDVLRDPEVHPRLVDAVEVPTLDESCCANALQGSSRGIELMVERRSSTGLSGWAAYSFGKTRYTDASRAETFWADFDQRHALNLFGVYRFSDRTSVGATWRAGTNFPIPGYLEARNGGLFVGHRRNQVRLPAYSRLDVRADRTLESFGGRVTLSVEVLNVMNRVNVGIANGSVRPSTGEAVGFTDTLLPRSLSAGALVRF
jgi:outer membrane cobalamin receptor